MTADELRALPLGEVIITAYPRARGVVKGVFSATIVSHSLRKFKKHKEKLFCVNIRWHYVRESLQPEEGCLTLVDDKIICPTCKEVVDVRLPNEVEKKHHLARVERDKGRPIRVWIQD